MKQIPDFEDEIRIAAFNERLVLFIGAGVSRIVGCLSWKDFAKKQLEYCNKEKLINYHEYYNLKTANENDPRKLLSICKTVFIDKNIKPPSTKDYFKGKEELLDNFSIYEDIYNFKAIFVTTNYDLLFDDVINKWNSKKSIDLNEKVKLKNHSKNKKLANSIFHSKEDFVKKNLKPGNLFHFHGSLKDENNMIITITDYMIHYQYKSKPSSFLEEILKNYVVVFVGYGLNEYEVIEYLFSKVKKTKNEIRHFMLYPIFENNKKLLRFYENYYKELGIKLIPYPIDKNGHDQLAYVIKDWSKKISAELKQKDFLNGMKTIDEVL